MTASHLSWPFEAGSAAMEGNDSVADTGKTCDQRAMSFFELDYRAWLENALACGIPKAVVGFAFNLYEQLGTDTRYGIEFVGTSKFDEYDSDWACAEYWEPLNGRNYSIPLSFSGENWDRCLEQMKKFIASILSDDTQLSRSLRSVSGIGVGFVDGDFTLIWRA